MTRKITPFRRVAPMIYAYQTPGYAPNDGWTKIGYTETQTVEARVREQTHTANIEAKICWQDVAVYKDSSGEPFTDRQFHRFLEIEKNVERRPRTEWFKIEQDEAYRHFVTFARRAPFASAVADSESLDESYVLRVEQETAVSNALDYFLNGPVDPKRGKEYLWNAKPRFGKTLAAYDLVARGDFRKVLVVSNRPSIANSWVEDFDKFFRHKLRYAFVSETGALCGAKRVLSYDEYFKTSIRYQGFVEFVSLQDLKGSRYFGGDYTKLRHLLATEFDLLVVDECHEGVDTERTEEALAKISRRYALYLSGTPFKMLASDRFADEQIFNWTYVDEQNAKKEWTASAQGSASEEKPTRNPYETLPQLEMRAYQISPMICDSINRGALLDDDSNVEYAFDLNEFFSTNENGQFRYAEDVKKFLRALTTGDKYPFSTPELRNALSHTLWILNRVASVNALAKLLKEDPVFKDYEVVIAAGDDATAARNGDVYPDQRGMRDAYNRVKEAIRKNAKTITLSVGKLTVGVTVPEWSGVLMLAKMESAARYMQAAFRVQTPFLYPHPNTVVCYRKETAYVFDFDPARTLIIFDEFANNLNYAKARDSYERRRENIRRLLNFFPVLAEDEDGTMVELDEERVMSIPRRLKSVEVVRRGFMCNYLFQNIGAIFMAPTEALEIIGKMSPAREEKAVKRTPETLDKAKEIVLDAQGEPEIPRALVVNVTEANFGPKIYEEVKKPLQETLDDFASQPVVLEPRRAPEPPRDALFDVDIPAPSVDPLKEKAAETCKEIIELVMQTAQEKTKIVANGCGLQKVANSKKKVEKIVKTVTAEVDKRVSKAQDEFERGVQIATKDRDKKLKVASSPDEVNQANAEFEQDVQKNRAAFQETLADVVETTSLQLPERIAEEVVRTDKKEKQRVVEEEIRARLRGFARTIPSFVMAYGDEKLTLANFDQYVEDAVFLETTGVTLDEFRTLRDGKDCVDAEGQTRRFEGGFFDETVFNDSVQEFLRKKNELANYFDESREEDIFDYIPPQKTNQIFTPRRVVVMMVDALEKENPGCFDDPSHTFADLYMKSGLYIAEIVKRLYRSARMRALFPDDAERIRHILKNQVYGMAPTRIIYKIATNYILGFDDALKMESTHFVEADAAEAAKNQALPDLVERAFA